MTYDNNKPFVPKSIGQMQKEYMETPFMLRSFQVGSRFTIVENHPVSAPMRFKTVVSERTHKPYTTYLIKINDGYIIKDLSLFGDEVISLFRTLPAEIKNLKDVTMANDQGKWVFICQDSGQSENFPNSKQIAASMTEAPSTIANMIQALHAGIETNVNTGIKNTPAKVLEMANKIKPGDGERLMQAAKDAGWIVEVGGVIRGT